MVPRRGNAIPPPGYRYFTEVRLTEFLGSSHSSGPTLGGIIMYREGRCRYPYRRTS
jgi:hypothetical protein